MWFFVRDKIRNGEYEGIEQLEADLTTMFENAKRYNVPNSAIYKRAQKLQQVIQVNKMLYIWFLLTLLLDLELKLWLVLLLVLIKLLI